MQHLFLVKARGERKRRAEKVASGVNPLTERRLTQAEQAAKRTFADVAKFVIERNAWGASSPAPWERSLFADAKRLAALNVDEIAVEGVKQVVTPIFDRGDHVAARRTLARIKRARLRHCARLAFGGKRRAGSVQKHIVPTRPKEDRRHRAVDWREAPPAIARAA